jgi:hypothetical protein
VPQFEQRITGTDSIAARHCRHHADTVIDRFADLRAARAEHIARTPQRLCPHRCHIPIAWRAHNLYVRRER